MNNIFLYASLIFNVNLLILWILELVVFVLFRLLFAILSIIIQIKISLCSWTPVWLMKKWAHLSKILQFKSHIAPCSAREKAKILFSASKTLDFCFKKLGEDGEVCIPLRIFLAGRLRRFGLWPWYSILKHFPCQLWRHHLIGFNI